MISLPISDYVMVWEQQCEDSNGKGYFYKEKSLHHDNVNDSNYTRVEMLQKPRTKI